MSNDSQVTDTEIPSKYMYWAQSAFEQAERCRNFAERTGIPTSYWGRTADQYDRACWSMLFLHEFYKEQT